MKNKPTVIEKGKFLIIEQGEYSDYSMYFIRVPEKSTISESDMAFLIGLGELDNPIITGHIWGEVDIRVENLKDRTEKEIIQMFFRSYNHEFKTIINKLCSKKELLKIAMTSELNDIVIDSSGIDYWKNKINKKYEKYIKAFSLYKKL